MQQEITQYYSGIAADYDQSRFAHAYGKYIHAQEEIILKEIHLKQPCLSLGCGTGRFMEFAQTGLDISLAMLDQAKQKFPSKKFVNQMPLKHPFKMPLLSLFFVCMCSCI